MSNREFDDFNRGHIQHRNSLGRMNGDLGRMRQKMARGEQDPYDHSQSISEWSERFPPDEEYNQRKETLLKVGIKVRTRVGWDHKDTVPMLMIFVDALPEHEQPEAHIEEQPDRFRRRHSRWTSERLINPNVERHVTIGKLTDIETFPDWKQKLYRIYGKFNNKTIWLYPKSISRNSTLALDPEKDPIASDPYIQEFHTSDVRWNPINDDRNDPNYYNDSNWTSNVPEIHISM